MAARRKSQRKDKDMAKRKKTIGGDVSVPSSVASKMHMSIDQADNGFIVRIDGDHDGKYHERKLVANSPRQAFRIAAAHLPSMVKRAGKKKAGKGKRFASKRG
jgi:hypothetical protein